MEGVVVEVRVRAPCKRFVIKGNGICDRSARGFDGHKAKLHRFFPLRTIRVVTRESAKLNKPTEPLFLVSQKPVSGQLPSSLKLPANLMNRALATTPPDIFWRVRSCILFQLDFPPQAEKSRFRDNAGGEAVFKARRTRTAETFGCRTRC